MRVELTRAAPIAAVSMLVVGWAAIGLGKRPAHAPQAADGGAVAVALSRPAPPETPPAPSGELPPTPFELAVTAGDLQEMARTFSKDAPLERALKRAAAGGRRDVVAWVLDHGADVHASENEIDAPVLEADAHPGVLALLFERGAEEPDLATAAGAGKVNAVKRLLAQHRAVNPEDGPPPLYTLFDPGEASPEDRWTIFRLLITAGADPNRGFEERMPLERAVTACVEEAEDTPAQHGCLPIVQALTRKGANVTFDALGAALLTPDPRRGPILDALLAGKVSRGTIASVLYAAEGERDAGVIPKLVARGVPWTYWTTGGHEVVPKPVDPMEPTDATEVSPLLHAAQNLDVPLVRAFLAAGAPANLTVEGETPLEVAITSATPETGKALEKVVRILLAFHANPNLTGSSQRTPLMMAVDARSLPAVAALVDGGAAINARFTDEPNAIGPRQETALDMAEKKGSDEIVDYLRAHGAKALHQPGTPADSDCTRPFFDAQGVKHYKPGCSTK